LSSHASIVPLLIKSKDQRKMVIAKKTWFGSGRHSTAAKWRAVSLTFHPCQTFQRPPGTGTKWYVKKNKEMTASIYNVNILMVNLENRSITTRKTEQLLSVFQSWAIQKKEK
jgi:hypothetical protein